MNANLDQLTVTGSTIDPFARPSANLPGSSATLLPSRDKNGFRSYDEEWAAFLAESSIKKSRPGINNEVPEALPRVWNNPI